MQVQGVGGVFLRAIHLLCIITWRYLRQLSVKIFLPNLTYFSFIVTLVGFYIIDNAILALDGYPLVQCRRHCSNPVYPLTSKQNIVISIGLDDHE